MLRRLAVGLTDRRFLWRAMASDPDASASLAGVTNTPTGIDAESIYGDGIAQATYQPRAVERGVVVSVEVMEGGNAEMAFATLRRRFREEGFEAKWRSRRHIRACLKRRQERRDAEYRHYKAQLAERLKWIRRFRDRGF